MKILQFRFKEIMEIGVNLNTSTTNQVFQKANKGVISVALLEEQELLTSIINQLFQHAPQWAQRNFESYSTYKDLMMFAVPHLVANLDAQSVMSASYVEDHLAQLTQERLEGRSNDAVLDKNNALRLKIDISVSKIYFNMVFALHALIMSTVGN
jgi:biotin-(acetyl-CoA carboxylase) ligase